MIVFASVVAGQGVTTAAVMTAVGLVMRGVPVLFADRSASQEASAWLEKREALGLPCPIREEAVGDTQPAALTVVDGGSGLKCRHEGCFILCLRPHPPEEVSRLAPVIQNLGPDLVLPTIVDAREWAENEQFLEALAGIVGWERILDPVAY